MMGLPTETDEDIQGIVTLVRKISDLFYEINRGVKGRFLSISVSCATFVPKPFTPFEFEPQITREEVKRKTGMLSHFKL